MDRLHGKIALVTGGTSGFGFSIARLFAAEGAKVVIAARRREKGSAAIKKIEGEIAGADVRFFECDVSKENEVKTLVYKAIDLHKRIDVLVSNAGILMRKNVEDTTETEWDQIMNTNLKGCFLSCKHTIPFMIKNGKGSIINISSTLSLVGKSNAPVYSSSKGGITSLTRSLALGCGKHNIRVNCICPGYVITELNRDEIEKAVDPSNALKALESAYPLGRLGTPTDVAYAAVYLASDESQYVTGIALPVDGGYTAGKE